MKSWYLLQSKKHLQEEQQTRLLAFAFFALPKVFNVTIDSLERQKRDSAAHLGGKSEVQSPYFPSYTLSHDFRAEFGEKKKKKKGSDKKFLPLCIFHSFNNTHPRKAIPQTR